MASFIRAGVVALAGAVALFATAAPSCAQPAAAQAEKTAFYSDVRDKHLDAALAAGAAYRKVAPGDDRFALDYAYALLSAHRSAEAVALLERLKTSRVAAVRTAASRQLLAQGPAVAAPAGGTPLPPVASSSPPPFTEAYELLAGGDLGASRDAFKATLQTHPDDAAAWRQLSFIDFALHDRTDMIAALDRYIVLAPDDDRAKLERAYALLAEGKDAEAHAALVALAQSPTEDVATAARSQLAVARAGSFRPTRLDVFGYAENDSRFHDTFYGLDARYKLATSRVEPYLAFHLSNDAKASSVPASDILNDNVAILAFGLRTKIAPVVYAFAEAGQAHSLLTGHDQTDLRFGFLGSTRIGAGGTKPQTQIDASLTHYSRYLNTIAYGNVAHDFFLGSPIVRGVVGSNVALDTSRAFYNNAIEGFAGVQARAGGITLRVIAVEGTYLGRGIDLPARRTYSSIRPELLFGFSR